MKRKLEEAYGSKNRKYTLSDARTSQSEEQTVSENPELRAARCRLVHTLWSCKDIYVSLLRPPLSTDQYKQKISFKPVRYGNLTAGNVKITIFWCVKPWSFISMYQNKRGHIPKVWNYLGFDQGHTIAQLLEALCYRPEGRGFDSRWGPWIFQFT
jgi:hypothetical protein